MTELEWTIIVDELDTVLGQFGMLCFKVSFKLLDFSVSFAASADWAFQFLIESKRIIILLFNLENVH